MNIISPTNCQQVWYHDIPSSFGVPSDLRARSLQPFAATIVHVWSDRMVNLVVLDHDGKAHPKTSVQLVQPGDAKPAHGNWCEWMPYQVKQAERPHIVLTEGDALADLAGTPRPDNPSGNIAPEPAANLSGAVRIGCMDPACSVCAYAAVAGSRGYMVSGCEKASAGPRA
jgi:hypothetical protein